MPTQDEPRKEVTLGDAARAVLAAFDLAVAAGKAEPDCYRAAVLAWREMYPEHAPEYAAKAAVAIVVRSRYTKLTGQQPSFGQ